MLKIKRESPLTGKTINKEITKFFKDGGTIKKIKPSERAMKEYVWHQETYPINYKLRYKK